MTEFILQIDKNNIFNQIFEPLANKFSEVIKNNSGLVGTKVINNNNQRQIIFGSHANPDYWINNTIESDIIVNLEPIYKKKFRENNPKYLKLLNSRMIFDYTSYNIPYLKNYEIFKIPPFLVHPKDNNETDTLKKFDVLFVGSTSDYRKKNLKKIMDKNIKLVSGFKIFSKNLYEAIKISKIYLHLNVDDQNLFNYFKFAHCCSYNILYAGHKGDTKDFREFDKLLGISVFETDDEMIKGIEKLLKDEKLYLNALSLQKKISINLNNDFKKFIKKILSK